MTSARRILYTVIVLAACLGAFAGAALADTCNVTPSGCGFGSGTCNSQGGRYRNQGGSDNGSRAYIAGSGHTNSVGSVSAWVAVTQCSPNNCTLPGGVQMGERSESSGFSSLCGTGTFAFFEYVASGSSNFHCPYNPSISQFGEGGLFDVVYQNGSWHGKQNGNDVCTGSCSVPNLGFTAAWSWVSDEVYVAKGNAGPAEAITYGPNGHNPWQFTTNNGTSYSNIQTSLCTNNNDTDNDSDGDWNLGGSPSPFNINWTGY